MAEENETEDSNQEDGSAKLEAAESARALAVAGEAAANVRMSELADTVRSLEAKMQGQPAPQQNQTYTAAQLQEMVEAGTITPLQMTEQIMIDTKKELREELTKEFDQKIQSASHGNTINDQIGEYKVSHPELLVKGSQDHQRASAEYVALSNMGVIDTSTDAGRLAGELMACRNVFGSIEDARVQQLERASHQDAGGAGRGRSSDTQDSGPKVPKELKGNADLQEHYRHSIDTGIYKGWDDPQLLKEMNYVKTSKRAVQ